MQKTFNNMWVVVDKDLNPEIDTTSPTKQMAIRAFTSNMNIMWDDLVNRGYTCVKVNVTFDIVNEKK